MGKNYTMKGEPEKKSELLCSANGCNNLATHVVYAELRPFANCQPAVTQPLLQVCEEHADIKLNDIFPDYPSWNKLELNFLAKGLQPPRRKYSNLIVKPINEY